MTETETRRWIRPDGVAKATGQAHYTADLAFPGLAHAKLLLAGRAHARIVPAGHDPRPRAPRRPGDPDRCGRPGSPLRLVRLRARPHAVRPGRRALRGRGRRRGRGADARPGGGRGRGDRGRVRGPPGGPRRRGRAGARLAARPRGASPATRHDPNLAPAGNVAGPLHDRQARPAMRRWPAAPIRHPRALCRRHGPSRPDRAARGHGGMVGRPRHGLVVDPGAVLRARQDRRGPRDPGASRPRRRAATWAAASAASATSTSRRTSPRSPGPPGGRSGWCSAGARSSSPRTR